LSEYVLLGSKNGNIPSQFLIK